jgi:cellulose/xylan binding protein with CBM9 domain
MTSAPFFFLRPLSSAPCLVVGVSLLGGLGLSGCFFELPELVDSPGLGGNGGSGAQPPVGGGGSGAGGGGGTGAGGGGGTDSCTGNNFKLCGGVCVSTDDPQTGCGQESCGACQGPPQTVMGCGDDGACRVESCVTGFADCNGDALGKSGTALVGSNGCDYRFGDVSSGAQPLLVPERTMLIDGDRADWDGIPLYAVSEACASCGNGKDFATSAAVISPGTTPVPQDLTGYFRISWDASNLYVLAEAFDDQRVSRNDATNEDGIVLFFDGLNDRATNGDGYENDDTRIYIGLSEGHVGFTRGLQPGQLEVQGVENGALCYRLEARVSFSYIVGFGEQNSNGQLPPKADNQYGFDMSFNDWDPAAGGAEPVVFEHQHQIFWVDPGDEWWIRSRGFGGIKLVGDGASDAGSP